MLILRRYREGPLLDWIMAHLGLRDPRELEGLTPQDRRWNDIKTKLRNLRVEYKSDRTRRRKIRGIVPNAGEIEFQREEERITVQECVLPLSLIAVQLIAYSDALPAAEQTAPVSAASRGLSRRQKEGNRACRALHSSSRSEIPLPA